MSEFFQSLLSSECANFDGVKELILAYLYKPNVQKPPIDPALFVILQVLSETPDKAVPILLAKQPTTVLLYAKVTDLKFHLLYWYRRVEEL